MSSTVITNIATLVTNDPSLGDGSPFGLVQDAAVVIDGDRIAWTGESSKAPATDNRVDAGGGAVLPGFVDSHSHLVFAGDRTAEFNARMSGRSYSAGGIRTTVAATRAASDDDLERNLTRYLAEALRQGTTTFETKSGYGLTVEDESRALRIAAAHTDEVTYLGAHIVSPDYADDPAAYVALVTGEMLDACAPYARWIDVFCEKGAFDGDQARTILTAYKAKGLHPRIHANQLSYGPGVQLAVELDAASADHCTHLTDADVDALAGGNTVATLLPGAEFSTRAEWPNARRLLDMRRHGRPVHRLQPGLVLHLLRALLHRPRGTGHGDDAGRGGVVGDRGRRAGAAPRGRRPPHAGGVRRRDPARRAQPCAPGLPAGGSTGQRGVAAGGPGGVTPFLGTPLLGTRRPARHMSHQDDAAPPFQLGQQRSGGFAGVPAQVQLLQRGQVGDPVRQPGEAVAAHVELAQPGQACPATPGVRRGRSRAAPGDAGREGRPWTAAGSRSRCPGARVRAAGGGCRCCRAAWPAGCAAPGVRSDRSSRRRPRAGR